MAGKKKFDAEIPPCPDPAKFVLVRGKYAYYWRRKRGTIKPAVLNTVLKESAAITGKTNRAAKHMMALLSVFTQRMDLGMTIPRVAGAFKKSYLKTGKMDFSFMEKLQFQEDHPIYKLFTGSVHKEFINGAIHLQIGVGNLNVKPQHKNADTYQLHAIMLYGDPSKERGIKIETEESRIYKYDEEGDLMCKLSLVLPSRNRPWIVLLYIGTKLTFSLPASARHHAMMVVATGGNT